MDPSWSEAVSEIEDLNGAAAGTEGERELTLVSLGANLLFRGVSQRSKLAQAPTTDGLALLEHRKLAVQDRALY